MWHFLLFVLFAVTRVSLGENEKVAKFDNYRVYRVNAKTDKDVQRLRQLQMQDNENYSFWTDIHFENDNGNTDIMVAPEEVNNFTKSFPSAQVLISDVQKAIDMERPNNMYTKSMNNKSNVRRTISWDDYYTYKEISKWLTDLSLEFPNIITLVKVGKSHEGRDILGVHIHFSPENQKKAIFLEGGMHAREWIGVAAVTYQLNEILRSPDPAFRKTVEGYDWYVFPIYNPDGYAFTFTRNRMWRKTRQRHGVCMGADPNRNWDFKWHAGDYNYINPCSESYAGPYAFSEPEMKQLSEYIKTIGPNLIGYISHHSYSQILLIPYGDSKEHRDNFDELYSVGKKMVESIKQVNGTEYKVGNIVEILYKATGNDVDWVKHNLKTRMTFIYELRDQGTYGFLLPADQIIPTGKEVLAGLVTMLIEFEKIDRDASL